ncbi:Integrator complex subunit 2 [Chamberlinius hualienensis]
MLIFVTLSQTNDESTILNLFNSTKPSDPITKVPIGVSSIVYNKKKIHQPLNSDYFAAIKNSKENNEQDSKANQSNCLQDFLDYIKTNSSYRRNATTNANLTKKLTDQEMLEVLTDRLLTYNLTESNLSTNNLWKKVNISDYFQDFPIPPVQRDLSDSVSPNLTNRDFDPLSLLGTLANATGLTNATNAVGNILNSSNVLGAIADATGLTNNTGEGGNLLSPSNVLGAIADATGLTNATSDLLNPSNILGTLANVAGLSNDTGSSLNLPNVLGTLASLAGLSNGTGGSLDLPNILGTLASVAGLANGGGGSLNLPNILGTLASVAGLASGVGGSLNLPNILGTLANLAGLTNSTGALGAFLGLTNFLGSLSNNSVLGAGIDQLAALLNSPLLSSIPGSNTFQGVGRILDLLNLLRKINFQNLLSRENFKLISELLIPTNIPYLSTALQSFGLPDLSNLFNWTNWPIINQLIRFLSGGSSGTGDFFGNFLPSIRSLTDLFLLPVNIFRVDIDALAELSEKEIRPLLPCLARTSLIIPVDQSSEWAEKRKRILKILSGIELVNSIVALLAIDFHSLEVDVKKEQALRQKIGGSLSESILIQSLPSGLGLEFERCDSARRLRLLISELLTIIYQVREQQEFFIKSSDLFDNEVYLEEVSDVLCIAQAELPALLPCTDVAEALLHVKYGPELICNLVGNIPDCFKEVCCALVMNGEKQDEDSVGGQIRMQALRMLCQMCPDQVLFIRGKSVELGRMPSLAVALTLDHCKYENLSDDCVETKKGDVVAFISGLLLGNDPNVRAWFAQYIRNGQKQKRKDSNSVVTSFREELLQRLQNIVLFSMDQHNLPTSKVVEASALLRLYCALKGIAGFKFQEDEINLLLQLLTSHPPPNPAGVRFVSLALCMLLACPSLLGSTELEKKCVTWLKWLIKEEAYFERKSGVNASFGEVLLLIAIHFHSSQLTAIADLVCSTLGMKIVIRSSSMSYMKNVFTQEIFTEQVVTAHAVKVPVTPALCGNMLGFLPVHCIHQLLKSRAFTKYKVPIKIWIYKQICAAVAPLHPVLPPLIEAYVNSIIIPSVQGQNDTTNEPISESEIMAVFSNSIFMTNEQPTASNSNGLVTQLLLLYYVMLYEDIRLSNMRVIVTSNRKIKMYSKSFLAQIPIKYLLQQAQKEQQNYAGLFSQLFRLLVTHYPHFCLVEDWLYDDAQNQRLAEDVPTFYRPRTYTTKTVKDAFKTIQSCSAESVLVLNYLLSLSPSKLWPFADCIVSEFPNLLEDSVPRQVVELFKQAWLTLNTIFPGRLWVMTVNALRPLEVRRYKIEPLTQNDIAVDPLYVLRCDSRVFRCAPILEICIRILRAFLAASRVHLTHHLQDNPVLEKTGQVTNDAERDELKNALILAQESAAVQILLEICLPVDKEASDESLLTNLREIQTLICSHLHQIFIADPPLLKLVIFQGYPMELIPITVAGIPSMHIALDSIPELLSQPQLTKQIFAIQLTSHLCLQYSLPKSFSVARLIVNTMFTLLGVLSSDVRRSFFIPTVPALVHICKAFPPLCEDVTSLLIQIGRICISEESLAPYEPKLLVKKLESPSTTKHVKSLKSVLQHCPSDSLSQVVHDTLTAICNTAILNKNVY